MTEVQEVLGGRSHLPRGMIRWRKPFISLHFIEALATCATATYRIARRGLRGM